MQIEEKLKQMGIELPDFGPQTYYGANYGKMKPFHRMGSLLVLSGHVPDLPDRTPMFPGRVGAEVTVEQGYAAARRPRSTALPASNRRPETSTVSWRWFARSTSSSRARLHRSQSRVERSERSFAELFGADRGIGCRATIGVMSLANDHCFETWMDVECR